MVALRLLAVWTFNIVSRLGGLYTFLRRKGAALPWSIPSDTTLEFLRCETEYPVDDLLVGTSASGFVFAQVKRSLTLSRFTRLRSSIRTRSIHPPVHRVASGRPGQTSDGSVVGYRLRPSCPHYIFQ